MIGLIQCVRLFKLKVQNWMRLMIRINYFMMRLIKLCSEFLNVFSKSILDYFKFYNQISLSIPKFKVGPINIEKQRNKNQNNSQSNSKISTFWFTRKTSSKQFCTFAKIPTQTMQIYSQDSFESTGWNTLTQLVTTRLLSQW